MMTIPDEFRGRTVGCHRKMITMIINGQLDAAEIKRLLKKHPSLERELKLVGLDAFQEIIPLLSKEEYNQCHTATCLP